MHFSWPFIYLSIYVYRFIILLAAGTFVGQITTLGDSRRYQRGGELGDALANGSTSMTQAIGSVFKAITGGSQFGVNLGFMTLGFVGIIVFLRALPPNYRQLAIPFLFLPSFNLWTSIASKEAVILFAAGFFSAAIAQLTLGHQSIKWRYFLALPILLFYKLQYAPALIFLIFTTFVSSNLRQQSYVIFIGGIASLALLIPFARSIGDLALEIPRHFPDDGTGLSTRPAFWAHWSDIFTKAPEGMWLSFFGPSLSEVTTGHILHLVSFGESTILMLIIVAIAGRQALTRPAPLFFILVFFLFWLLFANYPLGVMNPGTAVRYRAGYYLLVVLIVILTSSRETYFRQRGLNTIQ